MRTDQERDVAARGPVARTRFALLLVALGVWAPAARASSRPSLDPYFLRFGPSSRTVVAWQAETHVRGGEFLLLRGTQPGALRVAAILPAVEGSHNYRFVDAGLLADSETVYRLVFRGTEGGELVLVTARVERLGLSAAWLAPSPARGAELGRGVDPRLPQPALSPDRPASTRQSGSGDRPQPPSPPPKRLALS